MRQGSPPRMKIAGLFSGEDPAVSVRLPCVFVGAEGILLSVKPDTEVCEGHGGGLGDDRIPGRTVRPAAHRPPGHDARLGVIDKQTTAVRTRVGSPCGFNLGHHKAVQGVAISHRGAPWVFQHGFSVRTRRASTPAVAKPLVCATGYGAVPSAW